MTEQPDDGRAQVWVREANAADRADIGRIAEAAGLFPANALHPMIAGYVEGVTPDIWLLAGDGVWASGFAFCRPEPLTDGTWNLLAIAVDPARQRRGCGSALLAAVETRLHVQGARLLIVETSNAPDQAAACVFYGVRGYREEAQIVDFWGPGIAKLVFSKPIAR